MDRSLPKQPQAENILLIVVTDFRETPTERDFAAENQIREVISNRGFIARDNFFKSLFAEEGHLFDVYSGKTSMLRRLKISGLTDCLMLAKKHKKIIERRGHPIPFTCRAQLIYKILGSGGELRGWGTVSAAGAGVTKASAEEEANRRLADEIGPILICLGSQEG